MATGLVSDAPAASCLAERARTVLGVACNAGGLKCVRRRNSANRPLSPAFRVSSRHAPHIVCIPWPKRVRKQGAAYGSLLWRDCRG